MRRWAVSLKPPPPFSPCCVGHRALGQASPTMLGGGGRGVRGRRAGRPPPPPPPATEPPSPAPRSGERPSPLTYTDGVRESSPRPRRQPRQQQAEGRQEGLPHFRRARQFSRLHRRWPDGHGRNSGGGGSEDCLRAGVVLLLLLLLSAFFLLLFLAVSPAWGGSSEATGSRAGSSSAGALAGGGGGGGPPSPPFPAASRPRAGHAGGSGRKLHRRRGPAGAAAATGPARHILPGSAPQTATRAPNAAPGRVSGNAPRLTWPSLPLKRQAAPLTRRWLPPLRPSLCARLGLGRRGARGRE